VLLVIDISSSMYNIITDFLNMDFYVLTFIHFLGALEYNMMMW